MINLSDMTAVITEQLKCWENQLQAEHKKNSFQPSPHALASVSDLSPSAIEHLLSIHNRYWVNKLSDVPNLHALPLDYVRPKTKKHNSDVIETTLSTELTNLLCEFTEHYNCNVSIVMHALLAIVLWRCTEQNDVVIGTPLIPALSQTLTELTGQDIDSALLRVNCTKANSFAELIAEVKTVNQEAHNHLLVSRDTLVEQLNICAADNHHPLFQIMLQVDEEHSAPLSTQTVNAKGLDLTLNVVIRDDKVTLIWTYDSDIFNRSTIEKINQLFCHISSCMLSKPEIDWSEMSLLDDDSLDFLCHRVNNTEQCFPANTWLQQGFEEHVRTNPELTAVTEKNQQLTYAQLDMRSNQLANYLQDQGVSTSSLIAIVLPRSIDWMVSVLATLKAGAAYLPIDVDYPSTRIQHMIEDSQPTVILTSANTLPPLKSTGQNTLQLDFTEIQLSSYTNSPPQLPPPQHPQPAYVIYTSGSTGLPKGVQLHHSGARNLMSVSTKLMNISPGDSVLQFASTGFDAATMEWIMALGNGATLHIVEESARRSPERLAEILVEQRITHLFLTPALLHYLPINSNYAFKCFMVGGEVCIDHVAWEWARFFPLYSCYGPSETTMISHITKITPDKPVSLGFPLANIRHYVLNHKQQLVQPGAIGELYIAGIGVGTGYLSQKELNKTKFIELDLPHRRERLYRTGDLVRMQEDGSLLFVGRSDQQVKIHGFRIELGEIEKCLSDHPSITYSVVTVHSSSDSEKHLVCYIEPVKSILESFIQQPGNRQTYFHSITEYLRGSLPDFMVPREFVIIKQWPLTGSGKIDRNALPEPQHSGSKQITVATSEVEHKLIEICSDILSLDISQISMTDNFFALGGHSLLLTRLISSIYQEFEIEMDYKELFNSKDLLEISDSIGQQYVEL